MFSLRFIDLFAGLGGTRIGFEQACLEKGLQGKCVFTSEIKSHAIDTYKENFETDKIYGDITEINISSIPDHDFLLAEFPCQPFSSAGKRRGFLDVRGNLFFTIFEILKIKKPTGFLLENVEGLSSHNNGETLSLILKKLSSLGYLVNYNILDSSNFGVPQKRKRIYIVGNQNLKPDLSFNFKKMKFAGTILEDIAFKQSDFSKKVLKKFKYHELYGKAIKDKRGGKDNIHSWDIEWKGKVSLQQRKLLSLLLKQRRYRKWAEIKGIDWMDGMPLTTNEIRTFFSVPNLQEILDDLTQKGYLVLEHPKKIIEINGIIKRVFEINSPKGYNIVTGKLSFPFSKILDPEDFVPTIVATEVGKIAVSTPQGIRPLTVREGLRPSGFPETYNINEDYKKAFDLIGNTVIPPVIKEISLRLLGY